MKKFLGALIAASFIMTGGASFGAGEEQAPPMGPQGQPPAVQQGAEQLNPVPAQAPAKKATKKKVKKTKKAKKVKKAKAKKAKKAKAKKAPSAAVKK